MVREILEKFGFSALKNMQMEVLNSDSSRDLVLLSPTGSGKTLAFLLPLLQSLNKDEKEVQALILVPSRELALQIEQVFKQMNTGFKVNCCYGGHDIKTEKNNLAQPPAVLIGTPGRLAYHVRHANFNTADVKFLVLDEFDKALEFGFQDDMSFIIYDLPNLKRRMLTSATDMPEIPDFTGVRNAVEVNYLKDSKSTPDITLKTIISKSEDKVDTLYSLICKIGNKASLVFCNHREAVERISEHLLKKQIAHGIFHGGMEQEDREKALLKFRNGSHQLLITTDLASRGLDIPDIDYIIHYQLPTEEAFIHRNGRTARMHASGTSYILLMEEELPSFLMAQPPIEALPIKDVHPGQTEWSTLYLGAGRKDKINKMDIVGLLLKKGGLQKEQLGLVEVLDHSSYAAIKTVKLESTLLLIQQEKIKNRKIKIEESR